jgi:hypothetical protein
MLKTIGFIRQSKNIVAAAFGLAPNQFSIDSNGVVTMSGSAKRHLSMRPQIVLGKVSNPIKPTVVQFGAVSGYSLPIYASDDEEIFFNEYIAGRWDEASDINVAVIGCLSEAETKNDDFALKLEWSNKSTSSGVLPTAVNTVGPIVTNIPDTRKTQYSVYRVDFPIDWNIASPNIAPSDLFCGRLCRTAVGAGNVEMNGEFIVTAIVITYAVDKIFKA